MWLLTYALVGREQCAAHRQTLYTFVVLRNTWAHIIYIDSYFIERDARLLNSISALRARLHMNFDYYISCNTCVRSKEIATGLQLFVCTGCETSILFAVLYEK